MSTGVTLYTTRFCPYCIRARSLLDDKGVVYNDIAVAIAWLLDQGVERVAYTDVDVPHGHGVQAIVWPDPKSSRSSPIIGVRTGPG